jgi:hypothetical protein
VPAHRSQLCRQPSGQPGLPYARRRGARRHTWGPCGGSHRPSSAWRGGGRSWQQWFRRRRRSFKLPTT